MIITNQPILVLQGLETEEFDPHVNAYIVKNKPEVKTVVVSALKDRFPLGIYQIQNKQAIVLKHKLLFV